MTRGERNNNPGNIRLSPTGEPWIGEQANEDDPAFCQFDTPEDGIRALAKTLIAYQRKHNLNTVREMIGRWAPPSENDTDAYVYAVSQDMDVTPTQALNLNDSATLANLCKAIIRHENGRVIYSDEQVNEGVQRALT